MSTMNDFRDFPKVSIVIPTLNAGKVLEQCLASISEQTYPKEKMELIIADGGSTDETLQIAQEYNAKIIQNNLMTAESGKAIGVKASKGEFIALIDSDNILPTVNWLQEMIIPLQTHEEAAGSEPWKYTWRKEDGFITRYSALTGANDPFVLFLGNYDRLNLLTGKWTEIEYDQTDFKNYILATFDNRGLPTIGANGTVFRSEFLKNNFEGDYLFDIDILGKYIKNEGSVSFIKIKNGIIHTFCESDVKKFARKQRRRVKDYMYHQNSRDYSWELLDKPNKNTLGMLKFTLYTVTVFPLVLQSLRGFIKKPDIAWFFHPVACFITLWEYSMGVITSTVKKSELDRSTWKQ